MTTTIRSGARIERLALAACALLVGAAPASAQRDSATVWRGSGSGIDAEVARVTSELLAKKRLQVSLIRTLQSLSIQLQQISSDTDRERLQQDIQTVRVRLTSTGLEGAELRRKLSVLCNADHRPDGWLGVVIDGDLEIQKDADGSVSQRYLDYPTIVSVEPGSPAAKAGVAAGDRLLVLDNHDVRGTNLEIGPMLRPGTRLPMRVRRGVETRTLEVRIERRPDSFAPPCRWMDQSIADALREVPSEYSFIPGIPEAPLAPGSKVPVTSPVPRALVPAAPEGVGPLAFTYSFNGSRTIAGAVVVPMNEGLAEPFGVEHGLLVINVLRGTPAERSGVRSGDVLLSANGVALSDARSLQRAVAVAVTRELQLTVLRHKKDLALTLRW